MELQQPTKQVSHSPSSGRLAPRQLAGVILLVLISLSSGFLGGWLGARDRAGTLNTASIEARQQVISSESQLISEIAKNVGQSVVSIDVLSTGTRSSLFGGLSEVQQQSAGTGFIVSEDGVIITNRHVIPANASSVSVTLSDGTKLESVEVIGRTAEKDSLDVAFLKIKDKKGKTLKPVKIGDSSKVQVGDKAIAIGNALGQFQNTVTAGIISGYGRSVEASDGSGTSVESLQNLFQTDASINQGNSGGPLVNINGEVIGINTAVAGQGAENIGFAIPINDVQGLINSVLKEGKLLRPYLGVRYISLTDDVAYQLNLSTKRGAYLSPSQGGEVTVVPGSPADKAGLREKDIITKINNSPVDEKNSLTSVLGRFTVGDEVTLTIIRDGKEETKKIKLEAAPQQ